MTKLLLTGSAGFIGSHLARYLIDHTDWQIVGLDRIDFAGDLSRTQGLPRDRFAFAYHDLRAPIIGTTTRRVLTGGGRFADEPFDYVVHMAAGSHVDRSVASPVEFFEDNVLGTVHLLEWLRSGNVTHDGLTLYFSTDEVFGPSSDDGAFLAWDRMNPTNPYAAAKAGGELACPAYVNCYGMRIMISHGTNFFGPEQDDEKFIPTAVKRILSGDSVSVHTVDGEPCRRYYTHVENACSAVLHMLKHGTCINPDDATSGRYNITGERDVSNVDLVREMGRILGREPIIRLVENPPTRIRPDLSYWVDGSSLAATGWKQPVSFEDGLRMTILPHTVLQSPPQNDNRSADGRAC